MPSSSTMIATIALSFLAFASATPLTKRSCQPNFGGPPGLSIVNGGQEWSLAASPPAVGTQIVSRTANLNNNEFRVEFTGQPANTYLIKPVNFPQFSVAAPAGGNLNIANPNTGDLTQSWNIQCSKCGDPVSGAPFTTGCTIKSAANSNQCVQIGGSGSALSLAACNSGSSQLFDFGASNN